MIAACTPGPTQATDKNYYQVTCNEAYPGTFYGSQSYSDLEECLDFCEANPSFCVRVAFFTDVSAAYDPPSNCYLFADNGGAATPTVGGFVATKTTISTVTGPSPTGPIPTCNANDQSFCSVGAVNCFADVVDDSGRCGNNLVCPAGFTGCSNDAECQAVLTDPDYFFVACVWVETPIGDCTYNACSFAEQ